MPRRRLGPTPAGAWGHEPKGAGARPLGGGAALTPGRCFGAVASPGGEHEKGCRHVRSTALGISPPDAAAGLRSRTEARAASQGAGRSPGKVAGGRPLRLLYYLIACWGLRGQRLWSARGRGGTEITSVSTSSSAGGPEARRGPSPEITRPEGGGGRGPHRGFDPGRAKPRCLPLLAPGPPRRRGPLVPLRFGPDVVGPLWCPLPPGPCDKTARQPFAPAPGPAGRPAEAQVERSRRTSSAWEWTPNFLKIEDSRFRTALWLR